MGFVMVCLMVSNMSLDDQTRLHLISAAKRLARERKNLSRIKEKYIEGFIRTDWQVACCGSFAGFKFEAQVETECGTGKAAFLMDEEQLISDDVYDNENSFWVGYPGSDPTMMTKKAVLN